MKRWLSLLFACLALGLVAGCGDDEEDGGGEAATTEQAPATEEAPNEAAETEVDMKDIKFIPADITVTSGATVRWTNSDSVPHTVTYDSGPGEQFDSGTMEKGKTFEQTFTSKGKVNYVCTIHPGQKGSVTVE